MADSDIPDRWCPALRAFVWIALPFIFFLVAVERAFENDYWGATILLVLCILSIGLAVHWNKFARIWPFQQLSERALRYLSYVDSDLGAAIISMARQSAWGRWYAARHLVSSETVIGQRYLISIASSIVMDKILDGELEVRGRRPGKMEYEGIPRTHWRSSAFYVVEDPLTLWKIRICPRGVVQIEPDGTIHASDAVAAERTSQLDYDSMIVDAYQFEKLWSQKSAIADRKRRKFLREARRLCLDKDEIQRLS